VRIAEISIRCSSTVPSQLQSRDAPNHFLYNPVVVSIVVNMHMSSTGENNVEQSNLKRATQVVDRFLRNDSLRVVGCDVKPIHALTCSKCFPTIYSKSTGLVCRWLGRLTKTTESSKNVSMTLSRKTFSGYTVHATTLAFPKGKG